MSKTIIISPSGNFYGSEQVLWDFLFRTEENYIVFVPARSLLLQQLVKQNSKHTIKTFEPGRMPFLYIRIFFFLLLKGIGTVYLNEAGHNRFVQLLAVFFPGKKFVIHVRMLEDTAPVRWRREKTSNLKVISISKYIEQRLPFPSELIYDPYQFSGKAGISVKREPGKLLIGIVGRVTATKGLDKLLDLIDHLDEISSGRFIFHLYGGVSETEEDRDAIVRLRSLSNVKLEGFRGSKDEIYCGVDCILHLSVVEALGRIFFEAIDYGKPFMGFKAAGIAEIGQLTGLEELLIDPEKDWKDQMAAKMDRLENEYDQFAAGVTEARGKAAERFDLPAYVKQIDKLIHP
jgi:glycosyltransferase involved in cell wall biosynthesis